MARPVAPTSCPLANKSKLQGLGRSLSRWNPGEVAVFEPFLSDMFFHCGYHLIPGHEISKKRMNIAGQVLQLLKASA